MSESVECEEVRGLSPHMLIIPASLSLPPMQVAARGRAPTILQNDLFYTRIPNFVHFPILSATRVELTEGRGVVAKGILRGSQDE